MMQPQIGVDPMATLQMINQLQARQGQQALQGQKGGKKKGSQGIEYGRCVWVAGLPEEYQDCQKLLNIFGCFGNVRRIVFTDEKPDRALIEMDKPGAAMSNQLINGRVSLVLLLLCLLWPFKPSNSLLQTTTTKNQTS